MEYIEIFNKQCLSVLCYAWNRSAVVLRCSSCNLDAQIRRDIFHNISGLLEDLTRFALFCHFLVSCKMKKAALLLGFSYPGTESALPGIHVDLYRMYKWCQKAQFDDIHVVTDIVSIEANNNEDAESIQDLVTQHEVGQDIYVFVEELERKGVLSRYSGMSKLVSRIMDFASCADNILFYFTGHGKNRSLQLPQGDSLTFDRLFSTLFWRSTQEHQILVVLDCCHNDNIHMPFVLEGERFKLRSATGNKEKEEKRNYFRGEILCLVSSLSSQKSYTSSQGSVFTQVLSKCLANKTRKCSKIVSAINDQSKKMGTEARVYSSSPCLYRLWPWVFRRSSLDFFLDFDNNVVRIRRR